MGGACYANCIYLFNTSSKLPERYRELGVAMGFFFSNLGIILGTGLAMLLNATLLSPKALFPTSAGACPEPRGYM